MDSSGSGSSGTGGESSVVGRRYRSPVSVRRRPTALYLSYIMYSLRPRPIITGHYLKRRCDAPMRYAAEPSQAEVGLLFHEPGNEAADLTVLLPTLRPQQTIATPRHATPRHGTQIINYKTDLVFSIVLIYL